MRVKYVGDNNRHRWIRFAEISGVLAEEDKIIDLVSYTKYKYDEFVFGDDIIFHVYVKNLADYKHFVELWKAAKLLVKQLKSCQSASNSK